MNGQNNRAINQEALPSTQDVRPCANAQRSRARTLRSSNWDCSVGGCSTAVVDAIHTMTTVTAAIQHCQHGDHRPADGQFRDGSRC